MPTTNTEVQKLKTIQQSTGRTFHLATRLLPERARYPTYALYAFFRVADEIVDDPDPASIASQQRDLAAIRAQALGEEEPTTEVLAAFDKIREHHDLDDREIEIFLDAMTMDLNKSRYETTEELGSYLRGSSVAVANLLLNVFGSGIDPAAEPHAAALAEAFQLTNFLRDVREDVIKYDRIYLPQTTLNRHGVDISDIETLSFSEDVAAAIKDELERTEALYREGVGGIQYLPDDVQFGVLLAAVLYAEHHRLIRRQGYDVLSTRPSLSTPRRLALAIRTWFHWRRTGDPQTVFSMVSAVPDIEESPTESSDASSVSEDPQVPRVMSRLGPASRFASRVRSYIGTGSQ